MSMVTVIVKIDALPEMAQGIKEDLAMHLEQFGDAKVVEVKAVMPWQTSLFGNCKKGSGA